MSRSPHPALDETVRHLQALIRIDTVNPPGNELRLARYLEGVLRSERIETHVFESAPGRANLVARLRGDGRSRPVMLLAHMDVVGVEREKWSADPFGGELRDGYLYGRGAIDDKGMLAVNLVTMLQLAREAARGDLVLARDVVLVAAADEEAGGDAGVGWLVEHQRELIDAEFVVNEGGRVRIVDGRPLYAAVQAAEKVSNAVTVTARGPGGHSSVPLEGNAIFRLGRALAAISSYRAPTQLLPTTRRFFEVLSGVWPEPDERAAMSDLVSGDAARVARGAAALARIPVLDAVLRAGVSAVIVQGGIRGNVIPAEAVATLDVRTLPGQKVEDVVAALAGVVDDPLVEIAVAKRGEDAPASDFATPMFEALAAAARELDPGLAVAPYLSTGGTDSARLRRLGMQAYGVLPFPLAQDDEGRMHGHDERIPLAALEFGTRLVYGAVRKVAAG